MPSSNVTVSLARSYLCNKGNGFASESDTSFIPALNQVCERLIQSGKWQGMIEKVVFATVSGANNNCYITLPPQFVSVLGANYQCWFAVPIWSQFHQFIENGPGSFNENQFWPWQLTDMGDQFATQLEVTTPGYVWLYNNVADNGTVCRVFGTNKATGLPVTDANGQLGESIILNAPVVQTVNQFVDITGFQKTATKYPVTMWINSTPQGVDPYQVAVYQSVETVPQYHRYRTGQVNPLTSGTGQTTTAIQTLCQRRFFPVSAETDFVYPGSIGALKYGLQALQYENLNRSQDADVQWKYAIYLVNELTHSTRGGARVEVPSAPWGIPGMGLDWSN